MRNYICKPFRFFHSVMLCVLVVLFSILGLAGCGNNYTDEDDYANFVRWQTRYETEKELVALLREYDTAYKAYKDLIANASGSLLSDDITITFECNGRTVLTDENIKLVQASHDEESGYSVTITFDSVGTDILADLTTNNIGATLEIVEIRNGSSSVLSSPIINTAITNGVALISCFTEASANELYRHIAAKPVERSMRVAAAAYNEKRAESSLHYSAAYLPASLAVTPEYTDTALYLQKAEAVGFTG